MGEVAETSSGSTPPPRCLSAEPWDLGVGFPCWDLGRGFRAGTWGSGFLACQVMDDLFPEFNGLADFKGLSDFIIPERRRFTPQ